MLPGGYVCVGSLTCTTPFAVNAGNTFQVDSAGRAYAQNQISGASGISISGPTGTGSSTSTAVGTGTVHTLGGAAVVVTLLPMPYVCPVGSACAGKTDSTTSTTTATGTGTFYATSAQPVSSTVTATNTSTVTATNYSLVQVLNGGVTAARTLSSADVTGALGYTPGTGNGNLSGNGVSGSNALVDVSNGLVTATHAATSTFPTSSAGWLHDNGSGTRAWTTPTYTDVGADQSGAAATAQSNAQSFATSAVNSAVYGSPSYVGVFGSTSHTIGGSLPYGASSSAQNMFPTTDSNGHLDPGFLASAINGVPGAIPVYTSAHVLGYTANASATPTANAIPIANSSGTLNSWVDHPVIMQSTGPSSVQSGGGSYTVMTTQSWTTGPRAARVMATVSASMFSGGAANNCFLAVFGGIGSPSTQIGSPAVSTANVYLDYVNLSTSAIVGVYPSTYYVFALEVYGASSTCTLQPNAGVLTITELPY
jgi:hypothetical protein